jgi:predicted amino acid dehydrogenase
VAEVKRGNGATGVYISTSLDMLKEAQLVISVASTIHPIIQSEHLRPGAVVCDVARPRDVSPQVAAERDDVLIIDGGVVDVPGSVDFHFDFGFPPGKAYACMAETMALTLEGRFENFSIGKDLTRSRVEEIAGIAGKHGFRLSGFRSFEQDISEEQIERIRQKARSKRRVNGHIGKDEQLSQLSGRLRWEKPDF